MLFLTPRMSENEPVETAPAVQVNAMKFPSKNALTDIYKVNHSLLVVQISVWLNDPPVLNFLLVI